MITAQLSLALLRCVDLILMSLPTTSVSLEIAFHRRRLLNKYSCAKSAAINLNEWFRNTIETLRPTPPGSRVTVGCKLVGRGRSLVFTENFNTIAFKMIKANDTVMQSVCLLSVWLSLTHPIKEIWWHSVTHSFLYYSTVSVLHARYLHLWGCQWCHVVSMSL